MSHARRAIRFFGTVHSTIASTSSTNPLRLAFTRQHIAKTLVVSSILGFVAGFKCMEMAFQYEEDLVEAHHTAQLKEEYVQRFGRRLTLHGGTVQSHPPQKFGLFDA